MSDSILICKLEENLDMLNKMYDAVRLVNPVTKKVMHYHVNEALEDQSYCYAYWNTGRLCENCVSMRASINNRSFMKMELCGNKILMITSIPVEDEKATLVVELFKNVTETMMLENGIDSENNLVANLLHEMNYRIMKDDLTNLYNKLFLKERLPADMVRSRLTGSNLSILFIDIDNFKSINDNCGHTFGDHVLKEVTSLIMGHVKNENDWVARYGGDEIVICLNETDETMAYQIGEKMRKNIEETYYVCNGNKINTTVSIGVHMINDVQEVEDVLSMADNKMYKAKKKGKNLVFN